MHWIPDGLSMLLCAMDPLKCLCGGVSSCFTESLGIQQKGHTIRNTIRNTHLNQGMHFDMYLLMIEGQFTDNESMKHSRACI